MVYESAEAVLSISASVTQEIGFDPVSLLRHFSVHLCFVGMNHWDFAKGITVDKVEKWVCNKARQTLVLICKAALHILSY